MNKTNKMSPNINNEMRNVYTIYMNAVAFSYNINTFVVRLCPGHLCVGVQGEQLEAGFASHLGLDIPGALSTAKQEAHHSTAGSRLMFYNKVKQKIIKTWRKD